MAKLKLEGSTVTPKHWALFGVLGVALIGAIYWPSDDAGDTAAADAGASAAGPRAPRIRPVRHEQAVKQWPKVTLDGALAYDPFGSPLFAAKAEPPVAAAAAPDAGADLLALRQDGVSVIVRDGDDIVATVGERKLHVGDVIDGYRVVAIEMDGVVLERVAANQNRGK